jgi:hypothetical protein
LPGLVLLFVLLLEFGQLNVELLDIFSFLGFNQVVPVLKGLELFEFSVP